MFFFLTFWQGINPSQRFTHQKNGASKSLELFTSFLLFFSDQKQRNLETKDFVDKIQEIQGTSFWNTWWLMVGVDGVGQVEVLE